jgi:hypothetical protein
MPAWGKVDLASVLLLSWNAITFDSALKGQQYRPSCHHGGEVLSAKGNMEWKMLVLCLTIFHHGNGMVLVQVNVSINMICSANI